MSSELARLLDEAAPSPQSPLDPEDLWTAGRARHRQRRRRHAAFAAAVALVVVTASGAALLTLAGNDEEPFDVTAGGDAVTDSEDETESSGRQPSSVEELAAADPMDLIAVFGDTIGSRPPDRAPTGAPVTDENAAAAYGPLPLPLENLDALRDLGWTSAATQLWRFELAGVDTGWSSIRVTVSRFESLAAVGDNGPWTEASTDDYTPEDAAGEPPPAGIDYVCRGDRDASAQYYPGAFYGECHITIGDTTWIAISSVHPGSNSEKIYEILGYWLGTVTQSLE